MRLHRLAGILSALVFAFRLVAGPDARCERTPGPDASHHGGMIMPGPASGDAGDSVTPDGETQGSQSDDCHHETGVPCQQMAACAAYIAVGQPLTDVVGLRSGEAVVSPVSNIRLGPTYAPDLPPPRG